MSSKKGLQDARIAFFGTPELAVYVLDVLDEAGITPSMIITAPDKPAGRKLKQTPSPTKTWADTHDIETAQPHSMQDNDELELLMNSEWDLFIVAAYNHILPLHVLQIPKHGTLNVHPSLLPKNRGPSPIRSALLHDERDAVGVSIIALDTEMDHGPIVAQATVELEQWPVLGRELDAILFTEGGRLLTEVIPLWLSGGITPVEQEHSKATVTKKIKKIDGEIQRTQDGYINYLKYCAYDGWPGVFFFHNGKRIKVTQASYKDDSFVIEKVIPEGKKEIPYSVWENNQH
jgi:methionyl-tRNA formyltransferase